MEILWVFIFSSLSILNKIEILFGETKKKIKSKFTKHLSQKAIALILHGKCLEARRYQGKFSEKPLTESFPMFNGANASQLQDGCIGQG